MDQYGKGDTVHIYWTVTNTPSGVLIDPTTQTFKYIDPTGAQTNVVYSGGAAGIIRDSLGSYHYDLAVNIPGMWWTRVETGGSNIGQAEYRFEVRATRFS